MKRKTNQDFKKWVTTLTPDQKKFNFNKVYKVLRLVNKEDKFRSCVKQLAIDWQVPVTRLTEEQLRRYRREYNRTDNTTSSATGTTNEEVWEVLDQCESNDGSKEGTSNENHLGNEPLEIDSLQGNTSKDDTSQNSDITDLKVGTVNIHCSQDHCLEGKNLLDSSSKSDILRSSTLVNSIDNTFFEDGKINAAFSTNILKNSSDCEIFKDASENFSSHNSSLDVSLFNNYSKENPLRANTLNHDTSDDSDFESAERGLQEALKFSEKDVIPSEIKPRTTHKNKVDVLDDEDSPGLCQSPLINLNLENIKPSELCYQSESECFQSKEDTICASIKNPINKDYFDSSCTTQENSDSFLNTESQAYCDSQQCQKQPFDGGNYSTASSDIDNSNQIKVDIVKNKDKAEIKSLQIWKSVMSVECDSVSSLNNNNLIKPVSEVKSPEEPAISSQCLLVRHNTSKGKIVTPFDTVKDSVESNFTVTSSTKCCNHTIMDKNNIGNTKRSLNRKLEMPQEEKKDGKCKIGTNLVPKTEDSNTKVFQASVTKRDKAMLSKTKINVWNTKYIMNCNKEITYSSEEKHSMHNWWFKYRYTFEHEKISSSFYYPADNTAYENETWPDDPDEAHLNSLLSELQDLHRENSSLQESALSSELALSEEISDEESDFLEPTSESLINCSPLSVLDSDAGTTQDSVTQVQPPLPSYPPPRTPSPPPLPPPHMKSHTPVPASPLSSLSPLSFPYNVLSQEKMTSNIPLPPTAPASSRVEIQESTPLTLTTQEPKKPSEPLSLSSTSPISIKIYDSKNLHNSTPDSTPEFKPMSNILASQQQMPTSICEITTLLALSLQNLKLQGVLDKAVLFQESPKLKHSSFLHTNESSKSAILPELPSPKQALPPPKSSLPLFIESLSHKPVPPSILTKASSSKQSCTDLMERNIIEPSVKLPEKNTTQNKNENCPNRNNLILCRNFLRKQNLFLVKSRKSNFENANRKTHLKKMRNKKSYLSKTFSIKNLSKKVFLKKSILLRMKENLVSSKPKLDILNYNCSKEQKTDNACRTLILADKFNNACSESNPSSEIKGEFFLDTKNCLSPSKIYLDNETFHSKQLLQEEIITFAKEEISFEYCNEGLTSADETALVISQENKDVSKRLCKEENKEGVDTTEVSLDSSESKLPHNLEVLQVSEKENEDNKFKQFVDETIPGDPISCKYLEDEENIEISFEPVTHISANINLEVEATMSSVSEKCSDSLVEADGNECSKTDLFNDLQVSSSDDDSEGECYIRPRIINGFGDPFIIPSFYDNDYLINGKEDKTSKNLIKMEGPHENIHDLEPISGPLPDGCTINNNEVEMSVSSKSLRHNLQGSLTTSHPCPENNVPINLQTKTVERKMQNRMENPTNQIRDSNKSSKCKSNKEKKPSLKEMKSPLKPTNHFETTINGTVKEKEKSSAFKVKSFSKNRERISGKNNKTFHEKKLKTSESMNEVKKNLNGKVPHEIAINTTATVHYNYLTNRNDKSRSLSSNHNNSSIKSDSHVPLRTEGSHVAVNEKLDTHLKKQQKTTHNMFPQTKPIHKEKSSYQPSSVRKRLTSEVENIIPIKRDSSKTLKTQTPMPIKNMPHPLKRTCSLPEEPLGKIVNPVLDSIVKDMDSSPPPKSLIIKEPETQKYVAQPYWYNQSSTPVCPNTTNVREPPLRDSTVNKQTSSTQSDGRSVNTISTEIPLESKKTFGRSVSLNSDVLSKKEKNRDSSFKPKESLSFYKRCNDKKSCRVEKRVNGSKGIISNKRSVKKRDKIENHDTPQPSKNKCDMNGIVNKNNTCESLPSMPVIESEINWNSSAEKPVGVARERFDPLDSSSVEISTVINTSNNVHKLKTSCTGTNKPSIKVSIPISHFISLNRSQGKLKGELPFCTIKKTEKFADGSVSNRHSETPNSMKYKTSITHVKEKSKGMPNSLDEEKGSQRKSDLKKQSQVNEKAMKSSIPKKSMQNSKYIAIDNISPARCFHTFDEVNQVKDRSVKGENGQTKITHNELIQCSISCSKRPSTDSESEGPRKRKKCSLKSLHRNIINTSSALPSCLDKEKQNSSLPPTDISERIHVDNSSGMTRSINTESNTTNSKEYDQVKTTCPNSLSFDEMSQKILKDLENSNELHISISKENSSVLNLINCETSNNNCEKISKNVFSTLRVKHPSLLQTGTTVDSGAQQLTKRRISVITPEALSSAVISNDQESIRRHTWYMEPENEPTISSSELPGQESTIQNGKVTSLFSTLFEDPTKKTELINMFKMSINRGKKEFERMHDVIKCIELDYKQKLDVIESVKKLTSRDMVKGEINRAIKEYQNKLTERESFFRKTFANLLDHVKGVTDYVYLAFYVFLSQKVMDTCSETALKDSLLNLFKSWIQNDYNKHVFDQTDIAFSNDCEIILKLLREVEHFSLLLAGEKIPPMLNQPLPNEREEKEVDCSTNGNNSQDNGTNLPIAPNVNKYTDKPIELNISSDYSMVNKISESQPSTSDYCQTSTQSRPSIEVIEQNTNLEPAEYSQPVSESPSGIKSKTTKSTGVTDTVINGLGNKAQAQAINESPAVQELLRLPNLEVAMIAEDIPKTLNTNKTHIACTDIVDNEPIIHFQGRIHQESFTQPDISNNTSQTCLNNSQQPGFLAQSVSNDSNVLSHKDTGYYEQMKGLTNVRHNMNVNITSRQINHPPQMPSEDNSNSNIQHLSQQIQHETPRANYPLLVSQTNNKIDKYQSMRQSKDQCNRVSNTSKVLSSQENVISLIGPSLARQTLNRNELPSNSFSCTQNTGPKNCGIQSGVSQPLVLTPSVNQIYPQLQNGQGIQMLQYPNNSSDRNTKNPGLAQRYQTQSSSQEYQQTTHRAGQQFQPLSSNFPVQSSQQQAAQYVRGNNTTQQLVSGGQTITQEKNTNNAFPNEVAKTHTAHYVSNSNPNCMPLHLHQPINPTSHGMLVQNYQSCLHNQFNPNTDSSHIGNTIHNMLQYPTEQNIAHEGINPLIQRRLSSCEIRADMNVHTQQISNSTHVSSQILYNKGHALTTRHTLHRRISTDGMSMQTIAQPFNQSFNNTGTSRKLYHYQQNTNGNQALINRRSSIETSRPLQQTNTQVTPSNSSSNRLCAASVFSDGNTHQINKTLFQSGEVFSNVPVNPDMFQMSSGQDQSTRKYPELSEHADLSNITEEDLNELFSLVDSEKIMDLIERVENEDVNTDKQNLNMNIPYIKSTPSFVQTAINYDGTIRVALLNIDNNQNMINTFPDGELTFNGVHITKEQLLKFLKNCRNQVSFAGLRQDGVTTFMGGYTTADGRSFTQDELTNLMKGVIAMRAETITKIRVRRKFEKMRSNPVLIKTLMATACKDYASYIRIISILQSLAKHDDSDAQQAVQEIADILRTSRPPKQMASSIPVVVLDD